MAKRKGPITNIEVIEPPVRDEIKISRNTLLTEPVESLDDLLFWEERLEKLDQDYLIAEFNYDVEVGRGSSVNKRVFGIFTNLKQLEETESRFTPEDAEGLEVTANIHDATENYLSSLEVMGSYWEPQRRKNYENW